MANYRSRKKRIDFLMGPHGHVHDQQGMLNIALDFCKNLFAKEPDVGVHLGSDF